MGNEKRMAKSHIAAAAAAIVAAIAVTGCGGGGDSVASTDGSALKVSGFVIDGPIRGASVFLDLNGNFAHDSGEPISAASDAAGAFSLDIPAAAQAGLATALLVAQVPDTAVDADDGGASLAAAGRRGFTLATPASAYITRSNGQTTAAAPLLSPLTTLVAVDVALKGLSLADAKARVQERVALGSRDAMSNYVADRDASTGSKARVMAIALGEYGRSIAANAQSGSGISQKEFVAQTVEALQQALPSLLQVASAGSGTLVPVRTVLDKLPARPTSSTTTKTP